MIIASFFTNNGVPATGISPVPTIRIRNLATGSLEITDSGMTEIGDGWYKFVFGAYDSAKDYAVRSDGGSTIPNSERFVFGTNDFDSDLLNDVELKTSQLNFIGTDVISTLDGEFVNTLGGQVTVIRAGAAAAAGAGAIDLNEVLRRLDFVEQLIKKYRQEVNRKLLDAGGAEAEERSNGS